MNDMEQVYALNNEFMVSGKKCLIKFGMINIYLLCSSVAINYYCDTLISLISSLLLISKNHFYLVITSLFQLRATQFFQSIYMETKGEHLFICWAMYN